ncbi:MAG: hypothetical protein Q8M40_11015 [Legionella sp.]|nr:hypothetical protein [Legionella sp.]
MFYNSKTYHVVRICIGTLFLIYGINDLFHLNLLPKSATSNDGQSLLTAISTTGYLFTLMKIVEITMGILFLSNRAIPLIVLCLLVPFVINYLLFSLFLNPWGLPMAFLAFLGTLYFIICFRDRYKPLLKS